MRTLFQELQHRIDKANAVRSLEDQLTPMAHIIAKGTRYEGDTDFINAGVISKIGADFIEIKSHGMLDRSEIRSIQPINF